MHDPSGFAVGACAIDLVIVKYIWSKYKMLFKSYNHFHKKTTEGRTDSHCAYAESQPLYRLTFLRALQHLIKIYHVVQELWAFSLNDHRRTEERTDTLIIVHFYIGRVSGSCNNVIQCIMIPVRQARGIINTFSIQQNNRIITGL